MSRVIALVDLDDTLFQTPRKCPPDVATGHLTPLGFARDGAPLSYATPRQLSFLHWLSETTRLIPVTARSLDALRRVRLSYTAAICAHGGVMLDARGRIDSAWATRMRIASTRHGATLSALANAIGGAARDMGEPMSVRILEEDGVPLYVLAKHPEADEAALMAVIEAAVPSPPTGWTVHRNGNNVALLPPHLGKEKALAALLPALRAEHPDAAVIGIGDSFTDAPFMALGDFAMLPTGSQLGSRLFDAP